MHTIKGNARTYGLRHITDAVHETEQTYSELRADSAKAWEPEAMLAQLANVRALVEEFQTLNETKLGRKGPGRRGNVERYLMVQKSQVADAIALIDSTDANESAVARETLERLRAILSLVGTEKVDQALSGVIESMPSLARELGKEPPEVHISDNGIVVRSQVVGLLKNVFTHAFRNAVDHGLETADVRLAAGKPPSGRIDLDLQLTSSALQMTLRDDGAGLAIGKLRRRAIDTGVMTDVDAASSSPESLANLMFSSGFSTAEKVTEVSGRGVGMNAVRAFLKAEGGDVAVRFLDEGDAADWRRFEFVISLPSKFACHAVAT
jgi:chemotaxis protein histidine kinase CheA